MTTAWTPEISVLGWTMISVRCINISLSLSLLGSALLSSSPLVLFLLYFHSILVFSLSEFMSRYQQMNFSLNFLCSLISLFSPLLLVASLSLPLGCSHSSIHLFMVSSLSLSSSLSFVTQYLSMRGWISSPFSLSVSCCRYLVPPFPLCC